MAQNMDRYFPEGVLYEIVSWLSPKSVGRLTTINKCCYGFIKSPMFIATHLSRCVAKNIDDDCRNYVLCMPSPQSLYIDGQKDACKVYCNDMVGIKELYEVKWPASCNFPFEPIGSCNGVVCFTKKTLKDYGQVLYLWNPILRKFKCIKSTSLNISGVSRYKLCFTVGFWYDNTNKDYKLLRIFQAFSALTLKQCQVEVFSLKARSWKRLPDAEVPFISKDSRIASVVDGCINWLVLPQIYDRTQICSFNTRTETFQLVQLPPLEEHFRIDLVTLPGLFVYKGYLALVVTSHGFEPGWSVFVMKEFGVAATWQRIFFERNQERPFELRFANKENIIFLNRFFKPLVYNFKKGRTIFLGPNYSSIFSVDYCETISFLGDEDELLE